MDLFYSKESNYSKYFRNDLLVYDGINDEEPSPREEILDYKPAILDSRQDAFNITLKPSILSQNYYNVLSTTQHNDEKMHKTSDNIHCRNSDKVRVDYDL